MKRRMNKRMAAATLAGAMVLSMNGMAWAEVTEFNLTKEVTTDGNTHAPNTTFRFTITEGDASTFEGAVVSAGVKDGLTLDTANNFSFAPGDKVLASYTKTGKIKVDATKFTEPGVYHYLVTETQDTYDGITYDVTPRHVYVYVVNGTDGYEVEAVKVVKDGDTAKEDNLKIVNSYGDGSTPNDDIHDFIINSVSLNGSAAIGKHNRAVSFQQTGKVLLYAALSEINPRPVFKNKIFHFAFCTHLPPLFLLSFIENPEEIILFFSADPHVSNDKIRFFCLHKKKALFYTEGRSGQPAPQAVPLHPGFQKLNRLCIAVYYNH